MFGFSSNKLVVKPQKKLKAPSKGSAVEKKKMSAPLAHTFHTVIKSYFDHRIWTPVNSASLVVILNRSNSFTELYADFFFSFVMLASRSLNTFFLYFYLEDCTR